MSVACLLIPWPLHLRSNLADIEEEAESPSDREALTVTRRTVDSNTEQEIPITLGLKVYRLQWKTEIVGGLLLSATEA